MGNASAKKTNSLLEQQRNQTNRDFNDVNATARQRGDTSYNEQRSMIPGLQSRFTDYADTGGFSPDAFDRIRGTYSSNPGGFSSGGSSVASELSGTGGIDESKFAKALGGYEEFAGSGGGVDAEGIRTRANRAIPQFYKNLQNEQQRRAKVNPYGPNLDLALARQAGQQTQENIRDTETDISNMIREGRMFGIQGLGSLNTNIQDMIQRGKIAGGSQEIANAGLRQGDAGLAQREREGQRDTEAGILKLQQEGKLTGLGGLSGLYGDRGQEANSYLDRVYSGLGTRDQLNVGNIGSRREETPWWKTLLNPVATGVSSYFGARR